MIHTEKNGHVWTIIHSRYAEARNAMVAAMLKFDRDPDAYAAVL